MSEITISVPVTKSAVVEMRPYYCGLHFDDNGRRYCQVMYGEYHDGVLVRKLADQEAPPERATPVIDAVWAAMEAAAADTLANVQGALPQEEWGPNEHYIASLLAAAQSQGEE